MRTADPLLLMLERAAKECRAIGPWSPAAGRAYDTICGALALRRLQVKNARVTKTRRARGVDSSVKD